MVVFLFSVAVGDVIETLNGEQSLVEALIEEVSIPNSGLDVREHVFVVALMMVFLTVAVMVLFVIVMVIVMVIVVFMIVIFVVSLVHEGQVIDEFLIIKAPFHFEIHGHFKASFLGAIWLGSSVGLGKSDGAGKIGKHFLFNIIIL